MNREASMTSYLKVLPILGGLLTACASQSPVDEIVASNLAARGGKDKIHAMRSIRETGTVTASGGRVARVVREIKRPGLFRLEFTFEGTKSVFAHDAGPDGRSRLCKVSSNPRRCPPEADAAAGLDQRDIEGALVDWREKGHVVSLVGREKLPGGEAFKLKLVLKSGAIRYDFIDVASHQIVRSDVTRTLRGHATQVENTFSTSGRSVG